MGARIANEHATRLERGVQPFVGVEGERVGLPDPAHQPGMHGRDGGERADAPVDVEPEVLLTRDTGQ